MKRKVGDLVTLESDIKVSYGDDFMIIKSGTKGYVTAYGDIIIPPNNTISLFNKYDVEGINYISFFHFIVHTLPMDLKTMKKNGSKNYKGILINYFRSFGLLRQKST